jgi:predicted transcriptional regulator
VSSEGDSPTGSFTTYLQMLRRGAEPPVSAEAGMTALVSTLRRRGALGMEDWHRESGLDIVPFADALKELQQNDLIQETGSPEKRQFELTEAGRRYASSIV